MQKLNQYDRDRYFIKEEEIDKAEAATLFSDYLAKIIKFTLGTFTGERSLENQIELTNKIILTLRDAIDHVELEEKLLDSQAKLLVALFDRLNSSIPNFEDHIKQITPYSRLIYSELFTGSNSGLSIESELRKEILSSNRICFIVSFIKVSGINIFRNELTQFTERGGKLQVITTSYMGATEYKAIEFLSTLPNTEVKISYNTQSDRLHAKSYLFLRDTGFDTAYIGSSNISRPALTSGLEWNLKVTSNEISHVIDKFKKTFETYWEDGDFELFNLELHSEKLKEALSKETKSKFDPTKFFTLKPFPFQDEILERLDTERKLHGRYKNLVVAATGTGKTIIAAFDYKRLRIENQFNKLLFIAHRKEILEQAMYTFQSVLKDRNFGELWVDGQTPSNYDHVFVSIQTFNRNYNDLRLQNDFYDVVIIDEVHHVAAYSYRSVLEKFNPKILLGLTATPERHDNQDILKDFSDTIAAEIRLPEALNRKLLCPFVYFGLTDSVDISHVNWSNGKYDTVELTKIYTQNDRRVGEIIYNVEKYLNDPQKVKAIGFCVSQDHARYMAEKFTFAGFKADYLTSGNSSNREDIRIKLKEGIINFLFVVDIFNEGVDIEEIDTILFLRPTESLTIFLQQLGRGLRIYDGKEQLTVLDFVGHSRQEYDFENKFRALIGKTNTPLKKEIEDDFPHLPLGCSIVLEQKAKSFILENILSAIGLRQSVIVSKINNFELQTHLPLTLSNFLHFNNIKIEQLYRRNNWTNLKFQARKIAAYDDSTEKEIYRAISSKWMVTSSLSYFNFIMGLAKVNFKVSMKNLSSVEKSMALMLYYDVWQDANKFTDLETAISAIGSSDALVKEIIEFLEFKIDQIDYFEKEIQLPFEQALMVHGRYTREQILAAFQFSTFEKKSSSREGVAENKFLNTELLFIDLKKSDKDFSPTTLYDDYAINDILFHWQTQNATRPDTGRGLSYILHEQSEKTILLFVREEKKDEWGNTMSYVFLGDAKYIEHYGSKPMSIQWKLNEPIPAYLWKASAKMAVG